MRQGTAQSCAAGRNRLPAALPALEDRRSMSLSFQPSILPTSLAEPPLSCDEMRLRRFVYGSRSGLHWLRPSPISLFARGSFSCGLPPIPSASHLLYWPVRRCRHQQKPSTRHSTPTTVSPPGHVHLSIALQAQTSSPLTLQRRIVYQFAGSLGKTAICFLRRRVPG